MGPIVVPCAGTAGRKDIGLRGGAGCEKGFVFCGVLGVEGGLGVGVGGGIGVEVTVAGVGGAEVAGAVLEVDAFVDGEGGGIRVLEVVGGAGDAGEDEVPPAFGLFGAGREGHEGGEAAGGGVGFGFVDAAGGDAREDGAACEGGGEPAGVLAAHDFAGREVLGVEEGAEHWRKSRSDGSDSGGGGGADAGSLWLRGG